MNIVKRQDKLTADYIMSRVSDYELYRYYIGSEIKVGVAMPSVFRKDRHPSMCVYCGKDGKLHHIDYADDRFRGNPIDMVMQLYGLKWHQALEKIAKDMGISDSTIEVKRVIVEPLGIREVRRSLIQIVTKKMTISEEKWWNQYGISIDQLKTDNVYSVKSVYLNRQVYPLDPHEMVYAYHYPEGIKIYMPGREKNNKWLSSIPTNLVEGLEKLNGHPKVIITKSKKDKLTMENIVPPEVAIISVQNESTSAYTDTLVERLKSKQVWINYDNDQPGKAASTRITTMYPQWKHVNIPDQYRPLKDPSDMVAAGYRQQVIDHLKQKQVI